MWNDLLIVYICISGFLDLMVGEVSYWSVLCITARSLSQDGNNVTLGVNTIV